MRQLLIFCVLFFLSIAQTNRPEDVASIDGIINAYYEVVSRPAGQLPDRARDKWIHHPNALVQIVRHQAGGKSSVQTMSIDQYHDNQTAEHGFFEYEIHRITEQFGSVVHVWSTYAYSSIKNGPVEGRGINSIQLFNDGKRWWVMSWIYDEETGNNPIPADYLKIR
ncbi:MAG: hypothetical protein KDD94_03335 [Calditrichaeota bacterium]|nr:hypothetical protein [Calditrichota bacterium]